eukprot:scaffold340779_cov25-Prasinocladus_malaysianus.AAC.1
MHDQKDIGPDKAFSPQTPHHPYTHRMQMFATLPELTIMEVLTEYWLVLFNRLHTRQNKHGLLSSLGRYYDTGDDMSAQHGAQLCWHLSHRAARYVFHVIAEFLIHYFRCEYADAIPP